MADEHEHDHDHEQGFGQQQLLQVFQQKIGNLELTVNALIGALVEEDIVDEDTINEKAQEIIQEIQKQQEAAQGGNLEDVADELNDDE